MQSALLLVYLVSIFVSLSYSSETASKCLSLSVGDDFRCGNVDEFYNENVAHGRQLRTGKSKNKQLGWSEIVIIITMYQNDMQDKLIRKSFSTWLKQVGRGAHIVFVTDASDTRSMQEIFSGFDKKTQATVRLFKSSAKNEGYRLRYKIIDSLRMISENYNDNNDTNKKFFIKIDTDTFVMPEHLLSFLQRVTDVVQNDPVLVGKAVCSSKDFCYVGGAMYGFNKDGLDKTYDYLSKNPNMMNESHSHLHLKDVNLMEHEDYMVSHAFRMATGNPVVSSQQIYNHGIERDGYGTKDNVPLCYHRIKAPRLYTDYYTLFYNDDGKLRTFIEVEEIFLERKKLEDQEKKQKDNQDNKSIALQEKKTKDLQDFLSKNILQMKSKVEPMKI